MTAQQTRQKKFTLSELRKFTKARLIRIILSLQKGRLSKAIKRIRKRKSSGRRKKLKAGIHFVKLKGGITRKVRVKPNGQWVFLKGKSKGGGKRRKSRSKSTKRRKSKGNRKSKRRKR